MCDNSCIALSSEKEVLLVLLVAPLNAIILKLAKLNVLQAINPYNETCRGSENNRPPDISVDG
jgi:hypothetical protein